MSSSVSAARPPAPPAVSASAALSTAGVLAISSYVAVQMLSDIASVKVGLVGGLAVDMGTFVYPITFTLRDVVHKLLGRRVARLLIVTCGVINLLMAAYLMLVARVPADPAWGLDEAFQTLLGPVWRIVLASIAAEVVSELLDTEVYHWFVTRITRRHHWLRVLVSNSVSVPVDNLLFAVGAFGWRLPWSVVGQIFLANLIVKYAATLVSVPLIYTVREHPNAAGLDPPTVPRGKPAARGTPTDDSSKPAGEATDNRAPDAG